MISVEKFALQHDINLNKKQLDFVVNKLINKTTFVHLTGEEMSDALFVLEKYQDYILQQQPQRRND